MVAGSSGMVGKSIFQHLSNLGHEVVGLNRSIVDLQDDRSTQNFLKDTRPKVVIDAAAKVGGIAANHSYPVEFLTENLMIQSNLMRASYLAGVEKFVFLGSSCIYPRDCPQPIKEEYLMTGALEESNSAYAIAKIAGIELVNSYRKEFGCNWISLMPTNLYGPGDNFNLASSHVFPALIRRFIEASAENLGKVVLWGSGSPRREFLHVDDLARAVAMVIPEYDGQLHLNVGTGIDISISDLAHQIAIATGYTGEILWDTSKPDGTPRKVLDVSRINALGWHPTITLEEGIRKTVEWYLLAESEGQVRK